MTDPHYKIRAMSWAAWVIYMTSAAPMVGLKVGPLILQPFASEDEGHTLPVHPA